MKIEKQSECVYLQFEFVCMYMELVLCVLSRKTDMSNLNMYQFIIYTCTFCLFEINLGVLFRKVVYMFFPYFLQTLITSIYIFGIQINA